jgi:hypothetical protein
MHGDDIDPPVAFPDMVMLPVLLLFAAVPLCATQLPVIETFPVPVLWTPIALFAVPPVMFPVMKTVPLL